VSIAYIWWYKFFIVTRYGGQNVQDVHNFHAVLPALHPVAPGMKKESRLLTNTIINKDFKELLQQGCNQILHPTRV
jgi:hypothetical protein